MLYIKKGEIKNTNAIQWRKEESLQQMVLGQLQKNEIGPQCHTKHEN